VNKNAKAGANDYKEEEDVARFTVKPTKMASKVENFTIQFSDLTASKAYLDLMWDNTLVRVKIATDVDSKVMAQIKEKVIDATPTDLNTYFQAAAYYYEAGKDMKQALAWVNKATEKEPKFWMVHLKAKIQARMKDYKGAVASANQSIELAKTAKNDDYVRLNEKLIAETKAAK
jgi:tetratricopeptide (TPR) repeat protein